MLSKWQNVGNTNIMVSDQGEFYDKDKMCFVEPRVYDYGYSRVKVGKEWKDCHRLVAMYFLPNPNNYKYVNHKNSIKSDNRVDNLEWCTNEYNSRYAQENGEIKKNVILKINAFTNEIEEEIPNIKVLATKLNTSYVKARERINKKDNKDTSYYILKEDISKMQN